ncbi:hypothetical protein [Aliterella atlantica]
MLELITASLSLRPMNFGKLNDLVKRPIKGKIPEVSIGSMLPKYLVTP